MVLPTTVVTYQLSGKVYWPETDVLLLCNVTNTRQSNDVCHHHHHHHHVHSGCICCTGEYVLR